MIKCVQLVVGGSKGQLQLWNIASGRLLHTFQVAASAVRCLQPAPALDCMGIGMADGYETQGTYSSPGFGLLKFLLHALPSYQLISTQGSASTASQICMLPAIILLSIQPPAWPDKSCTLFKEQPHVELSPTLHPCKRP